MDLRELPAHAFARHPWEIARADFFLRLLRDRLGRGQRHRALDVGAGDGYMAGRLVTEVPAVTSVTCFDTGYDPAWLEARRGDVRPIAFVAQAPAGSFDVVLLLDVLEHADDDRGLLDQTIARTAPGGWVLVSVPAHPLLFSHHDELLGHKRRYTPAQVRDLVARAGLDIESAGQLFASLLVPRIVARLGERWRDHAPGPSGAHVETALTTWHHGTMVTAAVQNLLALDGAACRWAVRWRVPLPGLSTWVLARRR